MKTKKLGYKFENIAKEFLENRGYKILETNFTIRGGEIDIIAFKDGIISFVEVKGSSYNIDFQNYIKTGKIKTLKKTAEFWIWKKDIKSIKEYRFDLILVSNFKVIDFIKGFLD